MDQPTRAIAMLLGTLGAVAPEIVSLYRNKWNLRKVSFSYKYIIISILYALLGGLVAACFKPNTWYQAFYIGFAWPYMVSGNINRKPTPSRFLQTNQNIIRASDPSTRPVGWMEVIRDHAFGLLR